MASALECNTRCHLGSMFLEIRGDNVRSLRTYGVFRPIHTWHIHVFDPHVHMHTHSMSSLPHPRRRWSQNCEKWWQLDKEQGVMNVDTCHLAIHRLPFITTSLVVVQLTGWATSRFFLDLETTHGFACFEGQLKFAESAKNGKLWKWIKSSIDWGRPLTLEHSVASTVQPPGCFSTVHTIAGNRNSSNSLSVFLALPAWSFSSTQLTKFDSSSFHQDKKNWSGKQDLPAASKTSIVIMVSGQHPREHMHNRLPWSAFLPHTSPGPRCTPASTPQRRSLSRFKSSSKPVHLGVLSCSHAWDARHGNRYSKRDFQNRTLIRQGFALPSGKLT